MSSQIDAMDNPARTFDYRTHLIQMCISVYLVELPIISSLMKQHNLNWGWMHKTPLYKMIDLQLKIANTPTNEAHIRPIAYQILKAIEEKLYAQQINGEPYDKLF